MMGDRLTLQVERPRLTLTLGAVPVDVGGGAPAAHASTHASDGSDPVTPASIGAAAASHTHPAAAPAAHASSHASDGSDPVTPAAIGAAAASHTHPAAAPAAHASTHASDGSDPITPAAIGAAAASHIHPAAAPAAHASSHAADGSDPVTPASIGAAAASHTHPAAAPAAHADSHAADGSDPITPAAIGAAAASHTHPAAAPGIALNGPPPGTPTVISGTTATSGAGWSAASRPAGAWQFGGELWATHYDVIGFRPLAPSYAGTADSPGAGAGWWAGSKAAVIYQRAGRLALFVYDLATSATDYESAYIAAPWPIVFVRLATTAIEISGDGLVWISGPWADRATVEGLTGSLSAAGLISSIISSPWEQATNQVIHAGP